MSENDFAESSDGRRIRINDVFYRVVAAPGAALLACARSPEGRFHRDCQPALYLSPSIDAAVGAMDRYRRCGDAPRVAVPLRVADGAIVDLRNPGHCAALALNPRDGLPNGGLNGVPAGGRPSGVSPTRCAQTGPTA